MKIAVWHHSKTSGSGIPDEEFAVSVFAWQMKHLKESGLEDAASEIHLGINGDEASALLPLSFAPGKCSIHIHGSAVSEIPTMKLLRAWLKPGWAVLYHHTKGVTHPGQESYDQWRWRMEYACVQEWRRCVRDLGRGYDAVGCHWLTPQKYPGMVTSPFFGGTFWWSRSEYLLQLPDLPEPTWENRFEAESWIGRRRPYPTVMDYHPGWP